MAPLRILFSKPSLMIARLRRTIASAIVLAALVAWLGPFLLAGFQSFVDPREVRSHPGAITLRQWDWRSYGVLWHSSFGLWSRNSLIVGAVSCVVALLAAVPLGYAAGCRSNRFARLIVQLLLLTYLVPVVFVLFPVLKAATFLHLLGSPILVGILAGATAAPIGAWLLAVQFAAVPKELLDLADIDDVSVLQRVATVLMPKAGLGVVAVALLAFALGWSEFSYSLMLLPWPAVETIPLGMTHFVAGDVWLWDQLLASTLIAGIIPAVAAIAVFAMAHRMMGATNLRRGH